MTRWLRILVWAWGLALVGSACQPNPLAEGQRQMAAGDYEKAVATFQAVRDQHPDDPRVNNELGLAYAKQEKWQEAIASYSKALQLNPNYPEAHFNLGTVYLRQMALLEAEKALQAAIQQRPDYIKAYNNLGLTLMNMGRFEDAEKNLQKAIELDPDNGVYKENLEYCRALAKSTQESLKAYSEQLHKEKEGKPPAEGSGQKQPAQAPKKKAAPAPKPKK